MIYEIEIPIWSATDFAFLLNETDGWVNDEQTHYVFENEEDYTKMKEYLERIVVEGN